MERETRTLERREQSEYEFQDQIDCPRICRTTHVVASDRTRNLPDGGWRADICGREPEVGMVQRVAGNRLELKHFALCDVKVLEQRKVEILSAYLEERVVVQG